MVSEFQRCCRHCNPFGASALGRPYSHSDIGCPSRHRRNAPLMIAEGIPKRDSRHKRPKKCKRGVPPGDRFGGEGTPPGPKPTGNSRLRAYIILSRGVINAGGRPHNRLSGNAAGIDKNR
ncbi:unnamed protein product [Tenebrio molitor]|nr:unnamed protein product [Tenebrio molitor]